MKTSPPSARVAAMRSMQQQNCKNKTPLKHTLKLLNLYLKFSRNTLDTLNILETSLKHHWNCHEIPLQNPLNFFLIPLNLPWITPQSSLKHPENYLETSLKCLWYFLQTPIEHLLIIIETHSKLHETPFKFP